MSAPRGTLFATKLARREGHQVSNRGHPSLLDWKKALQREPPDSYEDVGAAVVEAASSIMIRSTGVCLRHSIYCHIRMVYGRDLGDRLSVPSRSFDKILALCFMQCIIHIALRLA